jgi:kinesin family protein 15
MENLQQLQQFIATDTDEKPEFVTLLVGFLERQRQADQEREMLTKKVSTFSRLVDQQKQQVQSERMVVKFRDNTINMLRKNHPVKDIVDIEKEALSTELMELRKQFDHHPEVTRFAAENLELRGTLPCDLQIYIIG